MDVILTAIGEEAVLTVIARKNAKLGLILLDVTRAVDASAQTRLSESSKLMPLHNDIVLRFSVWP